MKRLLKILIWTIMVFTGLILLAGLITQTSIFRSYLKDFTAEELNKLLEGKISIGKLDGNLFRNLEIIDLVLTFETDTLLVLPKLDVSYDLLSLIDDEIHVYHLKIIQPEINLQEDSSGVWNISRLFPADEENDSTTSFEGKPFGFKILLGSVTLNNASVYLDTNDPLIPDQISQFNFQLKGRYGQEEIYLVLENLSFQTDKPHFNLNKLAFDFMQNKEQSYLKNLTIRTGSNYFQSNFQEYSTKKGELNLNSENLDLDEFKFVLPDIELKNNPDLRISSEYNEDSLEFEIILNSQNERFSILGLCENYRTFFDSTMNKEINIVLDLRMSDIMPQNWSDRFPEAHLSGDLCLVASFTDLENVDARIIGKFKDLRFGDYSADLLEINADYHFGDATANILMRSPMSDIDMHFDIFHLNEIPYYDGTFYINHLNLGDLLLSDNIHSDLNFKLHLQGENFLPPANRLAITSEWNPSFINEVPIDTLITEIHFIGTQYNLDTLIFQTPAGLLSLNGKGDLNANHWMNYSYKLGNLDKIAEIIGADSLMGHGYLTGTVYGNPDSLRNDLFIDLKQLTYNNISIDSLAGKSKLILLESDPTLSIDVNAEYLKTAGIKFDRVELSSRYDDDQISSEINIQFDPNLHSSLMANLKLDSLVELSVPKIDVDFLDDSWTGKFEKIVYHPVEGDIQISGVHLNCTTSEDRRYFFAEGKLSPSGNEDFKIGIQGLHPRNIFNYLGIESYITGRMNFDLNLTGTAERPIINSSLQFEEGSVGSVSHQGVNSWFDYTDNRFNFDFSLNFNGKDSLTARGYLPLHLSIADTFDVFDFQKPVSLDLRSEGIPVGLFFQNLKIFPEVSGTLLCDFTLTNTLDNPKINGYLEFRDGLLKSPYWGFDYKDINLRIDAIEDKFALERLQIRSSDGDINASGEIQLNFKDSENNVVYSNMILQANNFYLLNHRDFEIMISADIKYLMQDGEPTIGGYVDLNRSSFYLPTVMERVGYVTNSAKEIKPALIQAREKKLEINDRSGLSNKTLTQKDTIQIPGFLDLLEGQLELRIDRNTWIRNPQLRLELGGNIKMIFDKGNYTLMGPIDIIRGQYDLLGRRFTVNQGKIDFIAGKKINPPIFLEAEYVYRTIGREKRSLVIQISGNVEYPVITFLENNNQITQEDAISIVLYGRKKDELSFGTQTDVAEMDGNTVAMGFVSNALSNQLTRSVGEDLSLDVIEVNATDNWQRANFVVGKYITENIFVTYKREFGQSTDNNLNPETISMEYEIRKNLFFQMIQGSPQESGYDLLFRLVWD
jgi:translocation and assembly module TamB